MAVDGVVIKCSRICNKHKYFVSVVEKVMNANVGKILLLFFVYVFMYYMYNQQQCARAGHCIRIYLSHACMS